MGARERSGALLLPNGAARRAALHASPCHLSIMAKDEEEVVDALDEAAEERKAIQDESGVAESDGFDLVDAEDPGALEEKRAGPDEPFRSISAQTIRLEMQMAFLDARLVIHNSFDHIPEDESTSGPAGRLKKDLPFPEYVKLVTKVAITLAIARYQSMGIRP